MLSRVAERLYWMARYLERAENSARMIMAFNSLALDMPRETQLSWKSLVAVTGMEALFDQHHQKADERNCVKFLMADSYNPSSIASCIKAARENVRTHGIRCRPTPGKSSMSFIDTSRSTWIRG